MKNLKFILLMLFTFLLFGAAFAQTEVPTQLLTDAPNQSFDIVGYLVGLIPTKYQPLAFVIVSTLLLWEQFLARTNVIKANSTEQMITGWIQKAITYLKPKA